VAKTPLPLASAAIVANGVQGFYLHARGIAQKPGGWANARYNLEMGPPLLAPLLVTMVGGLGLLAGILGRGPGGAPRPARPHPGCPSRERPGRQAAARSASLVSTPCPSGRTG